MAWPLTWVVLVGTLPGLLIGYYLRIRYLPDPSTFKLFVGCVLLYIGGRLLYELTGRARAGRAKQWKLDKKFAERARKLKEEGSSRRGSLPPEAVVKTVSFSLKRIEYEFWGERFGFSVPAMLLLALVVGVIGGTYGIGGGAIIAPFCVAVFRLPVYTVAGAALLGTFLTSVLGVIIYSVIPIQGASGIASTWPPDVALGVLFGIGGFAGMYLGARLQKHVPQKLIKAMLGVMIVALALQYIGQYFVG
jgi:hypothetical protein